MYTVFLASEYLTTYRTFHTSVVLLIFFLPSHIPSLLPTSSYVDWLRPQATAHLWTDPSGKGDESPLKVWTSVLNASCTSESPFTPEIRFNCHRSDWASEKLCRQLWCVALCVNHWLWPIQDNISGCHSLGVGEWMPGRQPRCLPFVLLCSVDKAMPFEESYPELSNMLKWKKLLN